MLQLFQNIFRFTCNRGFIDVTCSEPSRAGRNAAGRAILRRRRPRPDDKTKEGTTAEVISRDER